MPKLSAWLIRTSLVYLLASFTFGALILLAKAYPQWSVLWMLRPAHIEFALIGWTLQLTMGMAYWILPRFAEPPRYGNIRVVIGAVVLVNLGVWFVATDALTPVPLAVAGRACEAAAAALFAWHAWPRVKAFGA